MDLLNAIFPVIAWGVCLALFMLQGLFGAVITFALLGHLTQAVFRKTSLRVERT
ncbi:MAG: hypothetical protein JRI22_06295 [Deltaproteobacteria bacterium]|nr:hypothetical protein [Deltaproteobacteria bacterium]